MSITERPIQITESQKISRRDFLLQEAPKQIARVAGGVVATRLAIAGAISLPFLALEACAPAKTEQEQKAEEKITPTIALYNEVLKWDSVSENPDRAVTMTLGGLQNAEGIDPIFRDYHRSRQEMGIPADQASVLSVAANINEYDVDIEQTVGAYKTLRDVHKKSESQAAGLASIAVINRQSIDTMDKLHDDAVTGLNLNPDQAVPFVQYSLLLGGSDKSAQLFNQMTQEAGFSTEDAIILMPAVMLNGNIGQVKAIYDEIKGQVADGTPPDVLADLTVATVENDNDTHSVIYMYNYGGGGTIDHCRSVRLTQGTALRSSSIIAARPNLAPAMVNHTYGQGAIRPMASHGSTFSNVTSKPGISGSRVPSQGSARPSSTGSYGSSVKSSPSFSGGRGGVSVGSSGSGGG